MDSKLVVEQMKGAWQIKHPTLRELAREAAELVAQFDRVTFEWIPRARNAHADRLANEAMDRAAGKLVRPAAASPPGSGAGAPMTRTWTRPPLPRPVSSSSATVPPRIRPRSASRDATTCRSTTSAGNRQRRWRHAATERWPPSSARRCCARCRPPRRSPPSSACQSRLSTISSKPTSATGRDSRSPRPARSYPAELDAWLASPDVAPPGGESFAAVARRVRRGRESVLAAHPTSTVVVVSHVTPIKTLVRLTLDAPPSAMFRLHLDTASVSIVDYFADGNSSVQLVNDTSHLG